MNFLESIEKRFTGESRNANSITPTNTKAARVRATELVRHVTSVRADFEEERNPGIRLSSEVTVDHYPCGHEVSIEEAAGIELDLKKVLDDDVDDENRGLNPLKKGIPPCKRRDHNT